MNPEDIRKYCYFNKMRFGIAVTNMKKKHEHGDFTTQIQENLAIIVEMGLDPDKYEKDKSDAYLDHFMEENPEVDMAGYNPFYILSMSNSLPIDLIYISIDECRAANPELLQLLIREGADQLTEDHKMCVFDIFDDTIGDSFSKIRPSHP